SACFADAFPQHTRQSEPGGRRKTATWNGPTWGGECAGRSGSGEGSGQARWPVRAGGGGKSVAKGRIFSLAAQAGADLEFLTEIEQRHVPGSVLADRGPPRCQRGGRITRPITVLPRHRGFNMLEQRRLLGVGTIL